MKSGKLDLQWAIMHKKLCMMHNFLCITFK
jgi:hypothetical protein